MERRYKHANQAVRVTRNDNEPPRVTGTAAVYYDGTPATEYQLWDGAVERIMPGAFDAVLENNDARALFNHDANMVLGRTSAGTLKLEDTPAGLQYTATPPSTRADVVESITRGDVTGSSFAFTVSGEAWRTEDSVDIREITGIGQLYDVGPVTYPAYDGTTAGVRTDQDYREALDAFQRIVDEQRDQIQADRRRIQDRDVEVATQLARAKARS